MKRTFEKCKMEVIELIQKNNTITVDEIQQELGVNVRRLFGGIRKAFNEAGVAYPRGNSNEVIEKITNDLKENSLLTVDEIQRKYHINIYKRFKYFRMFCNKNKLEYIPRHKKRTLKKQLEIINYIKNNSNATQWEINKKCHTHVQETFHGGIFEAFQKAGIEYPIFRRKIYGTANKKIKNRAICFEKSVFKKLEKIGDLKKYVKTKNGIVDGILNIKDKKFAIEIKNYLSKPISNSEINQLFKYMKALNCQNGIIICNKKGNRDKIQIGIYNISIITKNELVKNGVVR